MKKFLIIAFVAFFLPFASRADVVFPTTTHIQFLKNGEKLNEDVSFTVACYGYSYPPGPEPTREAESYIPTEVYSFSSQCERGVCTINEPYYLNYRHVDYCMIDGTTKKNEAFSFNIGNRPYGSCTNGIERTCTSTFDIGNKQVVSSGQSFTRAEQQQWSVGFFAAAGLTIIIELLVVLALRFWWKSHVPSGQHLATTIFIAVTGSLLTLPYVWFVLPDLFARLQIPSLGFWPVYLLQELFAVFVEFVILRALVFSRWSVAAIMSLVMNIVSASLGLILF